MEKNHRTQGVRAVAVFDIGMTNKKVAVYDENLRQLDVSYRTFEPEKHYLDDKEIDIHNLEGIKRFFFRELKKFAAKYDIKAIAVTTHGATFVCLDEAGKVCAPCFFYTYEPGAAFHEEFYALAGGKDELQRTTFTPPLSSMINPAKGIYFLQTRLPEEFSQVKTILNYPSYWSYVLTGIAGAEPTYMGCHTYLWAHAHSTLSTAAEKLKVAHLMSANYKNSYAPLGTITAEVARETGLSPNTIVTMGIHDSNASLLPYLIKEGSGGFTLNSSGTWCVLMHPQETLEWAEGDIGNIVFFNQSALKKPVKTAIFLGGLELDSYVSLFQKINGTDAFPPYSPGAFRDIHRENDTYLLPEIVSGSGQFTKTRAGILEKGVFYPFAEITPSHYPAVIKDPPRFWALLDSSLVIQTLTALTRAGSKKGERVFTEGGFRKNEGYNALLASALAHNDAFLTNLSEATSFGAAMTAIMAYRGGEEGGIDPALVNIEYIPCARGDFPHFENYRAKWLEAAGKY